MYEQINQTSCRGRWQQERWEKGFLFSGGNAPSMGVKTGRHQIDISNTT